MHLFDYLVIAHTREVFAVDAAGAIRVLPGVRSDDFASALAALNAPPHARVALATPLCFRQRVRLPAAQVRGLTPAELRAALAFEAEPFSGVPAAAGLVGLVPAEEADSTFASWDVAVLARERMDAFRRACRERRLSLAAVLPVPPDFDPTATTFVLDAAATPLVLPEKTGAGFARRLALATLAALTVVCADAGILAGRNASLRPSLELRERQAAERDDLVRATRTLRAEADALRAAREARETAHAELAARRAAYADLLETIAATVGPAGFVPALDGADAPFAGTLRGRFLTASDAAGAAAALGRALAPRGWSLEAGPVRAADGDPVAFDCRLTYAPPAKGGRP